MKRYRLSGLLLAALIFSRLCGQAQTVPAAPTAVPAATGSLTGAVLDSLKREAVPYATVVLLPPAPNDKPVTGVAADDKGHFALTKLAPGPARLRVSYVGYSTQTRAITITAGATEVGAFRLPVSGTALAEAVVIGTKPVVEVRPDRLIYNADQDVTNAGGTAADVLRKAPLLAVDGEGNVKMRGSANFKVLVNNKPSPTLAQNLAEALKGIPAEQIQSVEIITTPPAKYDGEGTAGIINIVLKKGVDQGLNGRVGAGTGNRNSSVDASLNFRKGKVGFTSSGGTGRWYNPGADNRSRSGFDPATGLIVSQLEQRSTLQNDGGWVYGSLGLDYDPAAHHSLSLAGSLNGYKGTTDQNLSNRFVATDATKNQLFARATRNRFSALNSELTGTYTRTFAQARREWSVLGQYATNSGTSGYDFDQYKGSPVPLASGQATYRERSRNTAPSHEITAQTDFVQPFGEKQTLEIGLKSIWRRNSSVADIDTLFTAQAGEYARSARRATNFSYDQNVQATYATYSFGLGKKVRASLGGRVERTMLTAAFRTTDTGFSRSYLTPLPNGSAQYAFSEATSLRLAYSRRITRPNIYYLNPYVDRSDPSYLSFGNPKLDPELTDSYELSYNTVIKTATLNAALSVRHTGNAIEQVRLPTDSLNVTAQTFANVAANTFYQFNIYASLKPSPKWDLSVGPDVQYLIRRSPALGANRRGFMVGLNLNTSYKLTKTFTLQGFLYGSLPEPTIQGTGAANLYYQFGAKKSFLKEKLDLTVNLSSPFNRYWAYRGTVSTPYFNETGAYLAYQRSVRVYVGYRFGQTQQGKRRKSISNDDVKGGGNKQGGQ